mgnify:CR=1 FL=1
MTSEQRLDQLEKGKELVTLGTTGNGVVYAGNRKGKATRLTLGRMEIQINDN